MTARTVSADHVVERAFGGANHPSNYVLAHARCNRARSTGATPAKPLTREQHEARVRIQRELGVLGIVAPTVTLEDAARVREREGPP